MPSGAQLPQTCDLSPERILWNHLYPLVSPYMDPQPGAGVDNTLIYLLHGSHYNLKDHFMIFFQSFEHNSDEINQTMQCVRLYKDSV